jgi:hypothetical protein
MSNHCRICVITLINFVFFIYLFCFHSEMNKHSIWMYFFLLLFTNWKFALWVISSNSALKYNFYFHWGHIINQYFKYEQYYIESSSGCFCLYNVEGPSWMLLYGSWIYNLPVQSVPITTKVVSDLLRFPPPIKLTFTI